MQRLADLYKRMQEEAESIHADESDKKFAELLKQFIELCQLGQKIEKLFFPMATIRQLKNLSEKFIANLESDIEPAYQCRLKLINIYEEGLREIVSGKRYKFKQITAPFGDDLKKTQSDIERLQFIANQYLNKITPIAVPPTVPTSAPEGQTAKPLITVEEKNHFFTITAFTCLYHQKRLQHLIQTLMRAVTVEFCLETIRHQRALMCDQPRSIGSKIVHRLRWGVSSQMLLTNWSKRSVDDKYGDILDELETRLQTPHR